MDLICLADCGPSHLTIMLLILSALIAMLAAYWARWTIIFTGPLLYTALGIFGGEGYAHTPAWWLTATVLGLPLLGLLASLRAIRRWAKRPA